MSDWVNPDDFRELEGVAKKKIQARNKAHARIKDAKEKYIKERTKARSKKATNEKDAILKAPRFGKLEMYDSKQGIIDAYGWGIITESESDRLQGLWDEREELRASMVDGIYSDYVTECMDRAMDAVKDMYQDEIDDYDFMRVQFQRQEEEDEKTRQEMHEDYKAWKNGWGKYSPNRKENDNG